MHTIRRLDDPFHPTGPARASGMLDRADGHAIFWEDAGDPTLMPVILCHGGPGGASNANRRRFWDPARFRTIRFDQRGCGLSTPTGQLGGNSLQATIADMEAIRGMLGIERWIVAGGSWGSIVALAYAEAHPECCLGLSLTCTWLGRAKDIAWWFQDVRSMFPELWEQFASLVGPEEHGDLRRAYARRILGADPAEASRFAFQLYAYEQGFMHFDSPLAEWEAARGARYGRIFIHYAMNAGTNADALATRIGAAWKIPPAKFRHGASDWVLDKNHPLAAGFTEFKIPDESYWNLTGDLTVAKANILATSVEENAPTPQMWTREVGAGRVFVSIPGHFTWNYDDPLYRILIFRGMMWSAHEPPDRLAPQVLTGARVEE